MPAALTTHHPTQTAAEPLHFTVPRSENLKKFFPDDIFPPTRPGTPGQSASQWLGGESKAVRCVSMNSGGLPLLSEKPADAASKQKGTQSILRHKQQQATLQADANKKDQAFNRLAGLAEQYVEPC